MEHDKVILKEDGYLPGKDKERYVRFREKHGNNVSFGTHHFW